ARLDTIEVSVDVDLQHRRRVVRRPSRRLRLDTAEPELSQVKLIDKDINHANRIILANPIFQAFREQSALAAIPRQITAESYHLRALSHSLDHRTTRLDRRPLLIVEPEIVRHESSPPDKLESRRDAQFNWVQTL